MKIIFLGDFVPGGVKTNDLEFINQDVLNELKSADLCVANLEGPFGGADFEVDEKTMVDEKNIIYSPDVDIEKLTHLGINVVSLANNHIHNLGKKGLAHTISILDRFGIQHTGAGNNIEEADKPCVVNVGGKSVAFIGCCATDDFMGYIQVATKNEYGVNPINIEFLIKQIKELKGLYDYVYIIPHWGMERRIFVLNKYKKIAYKMIDAGADGIIGCHSHCVQPTIFYKEKPICFSLGNFFFPDFYQQPVLPIWYPQKDDKVVNLRITSDYVQSDDYRKFVWNEFTRIAKIEKIKLDNNKVIITDKLTRLNADNIVEFYNNDKLEKKLKYIGKWISSNTYCLIWFYLVFGRKVKHIIRRIGIIK